MSLRPLTIASTGIDLREQILSEVWAALNALGGYADPKDPETVGYAAAVNDALDIIEAMGGRDPGFAVLNLDARRAA